MIPWPRTLASRLKSRCIACPQATYEQAALFPFFDGQGTVHHLLLVDPSSAVLRYVSMDRTHIRVPAVGVIQASDEFAVLDEASVAMLAPLWHYDPWWMLTDERFRGDPTIPTLKATNCVDAFNERPSNLVFSSRLRSVVRIRVPIPSDQYKSPRFVAEMLPERDFCSRATPPHGAEGGARSKAVGGWRLDPTWLPRCRDHA